MRRIIFAGFPAQVKESILRFPVALLCCLALCVIDFLFFEDFLTEDSQDNILKFNLLLPLGFVLAVGLRIFAEDRRSRAWRYAEWSVIPLLTLYFFLLPDGVYYSFEHHPTQYVSYAVFCITALLFLCLAPFSGTKQPLLFWRYNLKIWGRALFSFLCADVFWIGLMIAIYSMQTLFDVDVHDAWFGHMCLFCFLMLGPLLFTSGIPRASEINKEPVWNYAVPRIVGQHILLPLLLVYLLILYAYGLKIAITWQLPDGWVSVLILAYSGGGLLVYFLLHFLYLTRKSKIARKFGAGFFYSELPLVALLVAAIFRRTADYGMTENRYYLWLMAGWLLGVSLYMICTRGKSLRAVFISFGALALLSLVGPWNAFNVSDCSQRNRLQTILAQNDLLHDGRYRPNTCRTINDDDAREARKVISYFRNKGNVSCLQPLFTVNVDSLYREHGAALSSHLLDLPAADGNDEKTIQRYFSLDNKERKSVSIAGYDRFTMYEYYSWSTPDCPAPKDSTVAWLICAREGGIIDLYRDDKLYKTVNLTEALQSLTTLDWDDNQSSTSYTQDDFSVVIDRQCKLIFTELSAKLYDGKFILKDAELYILEKD
ncbi:MAG: DUF4153 domain-containing protein [Prevotellaceae bacterium]|jgi:hypothetical protein|nr:DUF4153 domain-containing protein [Prevotellaceae bacterium]